MSNDQNLVTALRQLESVRGDIIKLLATSSMPASTTLTSRALEIMGKLAFAEGILFAETSLTGESWKELIEELSTK